MSYGPSAALQAAVFAALSGDAALGALVGGAIYDTPPPGDLPDLYVVIGGEDVRDRSSVGARAAEHRVIVSVLTERRGFAAAKAAAGAVADAMAAPALSPSRGTVVLCAFERARARRVGTGQRRRIDLTFRVIVEDD